MAGFGALVKQWAYFVHHVERGYDDCINEYLNDLSVRDLIEDHLEIGRPPHLLAAITDADNKFVACTFLAEGFDKGRCRLGNRFPKRPGATLDEDMKGMGVQAPE
jgi:hypothetical protein